MIQSTQNTEITLASNTSPLTFSNDDIRTRSSTCCGWLQHEQGSPIYKILKGGIYDVSFNADVTSAVGEIAIALIKDGVEIPSATILQRIGTADNFVNVSFNKKIRVCCKSDTTLAVVSLPTAPVAGATAPVDTQVITYTNANFSIIKLA